MSGQQEDQSLESPQSGQCRMCDTPLPLRLSRAGEEAASWVCVSCEARFVGVFDDGAAADIRGNVRLQADYFTQGWADDVPSGMRQFVADLTAQTEPYSGQDRRHNPRFDKPAVVSVAPLSSLYTPIADSFSVMTRNFSPSGLALIHTRAVDCDFIAVALSPDATSQLQFIARVVRCRPIKRFYEIGCELVARLGS
jgi:hypothetical protein